jgi:hypothetical protein
MLTCGGLAVFPGRSGRVTNGRMLFAGLRAAIKNGALVAPYGGPARWYGQVGIE